eukprot:TRINITY_DN8891_c0_g1_i1.p1 TRINITY_DN8891_c0_g1~~TRINITY_DN8891_c0_g1_i1.p1  ORF type:complete len:207 (-),score=96.23 TRINITY_DN8891_c0_g1_i1:189-809(-)
MKFLYFDILGRGEMTRLAFAAGGVEFEDARITFEQWPAIKPTTPRGQLPVLTLDCGMELTESLALLRYAGSIASPRLYPADPVKAARVDESVGAQSGIMEALVKSFGKPDEEAIKMIKADLGPDGAMGKALAFLDKCAAKAGSGYLVGDSLSIADCHFKPLADWLTAGVANGAFAEALSAYPSLVKNVAATSAVPGIAAYTAALKK